MPFEPLNPVRRSALIAAVVVSLCVACAREETASPDGDPSAATTNSTTTSPAPAAAPVSRDACAMISADELNTAAGIAGTGTKSTSGGADVCTWISSAGKSAIVQLYPNESSYESSRRAFEGLYETKSEALTGLGEQAFYISGKTGPFETATVSALKGPNAVSVQVMGMGDAAAFKQEAIALTQVVLGKL